MDIPPLDIPLVRQEPKSEDDLRCCAQMVFSYFKDETTKEKVRKSIHVYMKHSGLVRSYFQDLGRFALKKGYKAIIFHYDWKWWNTDILNSMSKSKKAFTKALSELKKEKKEWADKKIVQKEIAYINEGGIFKFEMPTLDNIDNFLIQRIPVFITVCAEDFYKSPNEKFTHAILVTGVSGESHTILDPYLAVSEINSKELLYSWVRSGGRMLVIIPTEKSIKKVSPKSQQTKLL